MSKSIMIIDDSANQRQIVLQVIKKSDLFNRYKEANDGLEGFMSLINAPVDLIICDLHMPRVDGFKFISMVKARPDLQDIPIIILTTSEDGDLKMKGLDAGASDYVTKPFHPGELLARIRAQLQITKLQQELKKSNELLKQLSYTDYLTNIFNRRYLMKALAGEVNRAGRNNQCFSLILLDIDKFKKINDNYGHLNGDNVLIAIAKTLHQMLRSYATFARYGGEEFAIVLPTTTQDGARIIAERMRAAIQELSFDPPMEQVTVTASFGAASYPSEQCKDIDSLIRQADKALYRAKKNGRNRVEAS